MGKCKHCGNAYGDGIYCAAKDGLSYCKPEPAAQSRVDALVASARNPTKAYTATVAPTSDDAEARARNLIARINHVDSFAAHVWRAEVAIVAAALRAAEERGFSRGQYAAIPPGKLDSLIRAAEERGRRAERERALEDALHCCEIRRDRHEMESARQAEGGYERASDHSFDMQTEAECCAQGIRALKAKA